MTTSTEAAIYLSDLCNGDPSPEAIASERAVSQSARRKALDRARYGKGLKDQAWINEAREIGQAFELVVSGQSK